MPASPHHASEKSLWSTAQSREISTRVFRADRGQRAVTLAQLGPGVSPHTLRRTAATWLMKNVTDPWRAAGYLGMSVETLLRVYGHHHPDHLKDAVAKMTAKPTASASPQKRTEKKKTNVVKIQ